MLRLYNHFFENGRTVIVRHKPSGQEYDGTVMSRGMEGVGGKPVDKKTARDNVAKYVMVYIEEFSGVELNNAEWEYVRSYEKTL